GKVTSVFGHLQVLCGHHALGSPERAPRLRPPEARRRLRRSDRLHHDLSGIIGLTASALCLVCVFCVCLCVCVCVSPSLPMCGCVCLSLSPYVCVWVCVSLSLSLRLWVCAL